MGLFSIFKSKKGRSPEENFWHWFQANSETIFNLEENTDFTLDKLSAELAKVSPELTFEISPKQDDCTREFVISADGIKGVFPIVEKLHSSAPDMKSWKITKFRPRRSPINDITLSGVSIKSDDVYYNLYEDGEKLGIVIFMDDYCEQESNTYEHIGYLILDEAIGEYDVETKLGFIEFRSKEGESFSTARPIKELSSHVDEYFENC